ncbi:PREDICTED: galactosylgalactosylxylosylprotein 3-beta-glucuronosyltransferase 3-like [Amphimedon queenslandica]|uniref:Galactosylgalactosylxylosylprotein 3-beta-glucuronosyltransferase n=1 Tax=Amphimedon queenslandica TaxID=400682 RepID=A0A1X7UYA6_AMPQE|nr:PREDICTED: galactosylgalactosylxylosylprotein 3-beta-glucuronosyltransferase 3-like [Amphimedon queenslandica]|eukprot:XP_019851611.1 PREDICTED: galactosylgalactosylxylosylprotein 3-beta-glucuronosyltransferase 3-like [Amphimedon queenslandica]
MHVNSEDGDRSNLFPMKKSMMPRSKFKTTLMCIGLLGSHLFVAILVAINVRSEDVPEVSQIARKDLPSCFNAPIIHTNEAEKERGGGAVHEKIVFVITPTYKRHTQKVDLLTLCHSLSLSRTQVKWIVVEDSNNPTPLVSNLLSLCPVSSVHLSVKTPRKKTLVAKLFWKIMHGHRGLEQRNIALQWLRDNYSAKDCRGGVIYFADDDNRYDHRIFDVISKTVKAAVWPVGFAGHILYEGPVCHNNTITKWKSWAVRVGTNRKIPIDMAGFAVNLCQLFEKPEVYFDNAWSRGQLETEFLYQFVTNKEELECRGSDKEVLVWHVRTAKPSLYSGYQLEHFLET